METHKALAPLGEEVQRFFRFLKSEHRVGEDAGVDRDTLVLRSNSNEKGTVSGSTNNKSKTKDS